MRSLIHEHSTRVIGVDGTKYVGRTYAECRHDGTWFAWLEFEPLEWNKPMLHTEQETSQPNRAAVEYWAGGLQATYLEGALGRAHV